AKLRLEMRAEIRRIHRNSPRTMIYVTHDQKEALSMADRVALMRDGRVVQVGTPEEVYVAPATLFAAQFIGNCNIVRGTVRRLADGKAFVETSAGTLSGKVGDASLGEGAPAVLTVRPELLHPARAGEPNAFAARVLSRMYLGEMVQYQVESNGVELTATVLGAAAAGWSEGETVTLAFDEDLAIAFAPEGTDDPSTPLGAGT
ncbi:MAG TPA: ABC transporter ATP-binding protein, partial [Planctomycetota bacterium]|nr:ABC transporter ATP-binding protein [Planctomycetota bacterium]